MKKLLKTMLSDGGVRRIKGIFYVINNKRMLRKRKKIKPFVNKIHPLGINLIGDIKAETGLGQSMRLVADLLRKNGVPFTVLQVDSSKELLHSETTYNQWIGKEPVYSHNLIHINPNIWAKIYLELSNHLLDGRYNMAYWLWELEEFPKEWQPCIDTVDEIWSPSEFIGRSISKCTNKPVKTVPYQIETAPDTQIKRAYFGLPTDCFLFLVMYDFKSISERKNPRAAIEAYKIFAKKIDLLQRKKYQQCKPPGLVIKVSHVGEGKELEQLKKELKDIGEIYYLTDNLTRIEVESLIANVDVLVSLHRSEGFGLPLAEAMQIGTPVIATNWSSNTEFMDGESACLVQYQLVMLEEDIGPYKKGNRWADADVNHAAFCMEQLYLDEKFYEKVRLNARKKINEIGVVSFREYGGK